MLTTNLKKIIAEISVGLSVEMVVHSAYRYNVVCLLMTQKSVWLKTLFCCWHRYNIDMKICCVFIFLQNAILWIRKLPERKSFKHPCDMSTLLRCVLLITIRNFRSTLFLLPLNVLNSSLIDFLREEMRHWKIFFIVFEIN